MSIGNFDTQTYIITDSNLHIEDSSLMCKDDVYGIIERAFQAMPTSNVWNRSLFSLMSEWAAHKAAYRLGYKVERTQSVDLNYPQKWHARIGYGIVGLIVWIFCLTN